MSDFFNSKEVKTRKEHLCSFCNQIIKKGKKAEYRSGMFDGEWFVQYLCCFCSKYINLYNYKHDYELGECDFFYLEIEDPKCKVCGSTVSMINNNIDDEQIKTKCIECEEYNLFSWDEVIEGEKEDM